MKKLTKEELANVSGGGHWELMDVDVGDEYPFHKWVWIKDNPDDPDKPDSLYLPEELRGIIAVPDGSDEDIFPDLYSPDGIILPDEDIRDENWW